MVGCSASWCPLRPWGQLEPVELYCSCELVTLYKLVDSMSYQQWVYSHFSNATDVVGFFVLRGWITGVRLSLCALFCLNCFFVSKLENQPLSERVNVSDSDASRKDLKTLTQCPSDQWAQNGRTFKVQIQTLSVNLAKPCLGYTLSQNNRKLYFRTIHS